MNQVRRLPLFLCIIFVLTAGIVSILGTGGGGSSSDGNNATSTINYKVNEADWLLLSNQIDIGDNGTVDHLETRTYDANDNLKREELDMGNDGTVDEYRAYTYNAANQLTGITTNEDGVYEVHTLTTDVNGMPTLDSVDINGNMTVDYTVAYTYDLNRYPASLTFTNLTNVTRIKYWEWDEASPDIDDTTRHTQSSGMPVENFAYAYTYNGDGDKIYEEYDMYGDGSVVSVTAWDISFTGDRKIIKEDRDDDGDYEWAETTTYDQNDNKLVEETDTDYDLIFDKKEYYTYDTYGNLLTEKDYDVNDELIQAEYFSYVENSAGRLIVTWKTDDDGNGSIDYVQTLTLERR